MIIRIPFLVILIEICFQSLLFASSGFSPVLEKDASEPEDSVAGMAVTDTIVTLGLYRTNTIFQTAATSELRGKEIRSIGNASLPQLLTGKIAGLFVIPMSFQPGNENSLLMTRGTHAFGYTSPLVVVDGIPDRDITLLDPADIDNIVLLKDGAAAVYGSRGSNGVLFVNTRHGKPGKPVLNLYLSQGFSQPARIPDMIDAATYAVMKNEYAAYNGLGPYYTAEEINAFKTGTDPLRYPNTDWFGKVYRKASGFSSLHADLQGGKTKFRYYVSAGTRNQDGINTHSAYRNRLNQVRTNLDGTLGFLWYQGGFGYQQENGQAPTYNEGNVVTRIFNAKPVGVAFWPGDKPNGSFDYSENPALMGSSFYGSNKMNRDYFNSFVALSADLPFVRGMTVNVLYAQDLRSKVQTNSEKPYTLYFWSGLLDPDSGEPVLTSNTHDEHLSQYHTQSRYTQKTERIDIQYARTFGRLTSTIYSGFERISTKNHFSRQVASFDGNVFIPDPGSLSFQDQNQHRMDYYAGINLHFKNKYILYFNGNHSVTPYLIATQKRLTYYSTSAAWNISEENFWKRSLSWFNFFNIHSSWGITGNETTELPDFQIEANSGFSSITMSAGGFDLKTTSKFNLGLQGVVKDGLVSFTLDVFNDIRKSNISVEPGTNNPIFYELRNHGLEGVLSLKKTLGAASFGMSFSGTYANNRMNRFYEYNGIPSSQKMTGKSYSSFGMMYSTDGIYKNIQEVSTSTHLPYAQPGDIRFKDQNGDATIDGLDRLRIEKDIMPHFQGGITMAIQYHGFSLSAFLQGAAGGMYYIDDQGLDGQCNYFEEIGGGRWTPDHPNASYPRTGNRDEAYWKSYHNTFWLRSTDYVRLKELEVGYTMGRRFNQALRMRQCRISILGYNLVTLDKFKLADPEMPYHRASTNYGQITPEGISYKQYPQVRSIELRLNCSF